MQEFTNHTSTGKASYHANKCFKVASTATGGKPTCNAAPPPLPPGRNKQPVISCVHLTATATSLSDYNVPDECPSLAAALADSPKVYAETQFTSTSTSSMLTVIKKTSK